MMKKPLILVVNPGSTSTKLAIFRGERREHEKTLSHNAEELKKFGSVSGQLRFRQEAVLGFLDEIGLKPRDFSCVMGRGGLLKPIEGGTYLVDDTMYRELLTPRKEHASNLGGLIAKEIADTAGIKAFIADPVVVDEMEPVARVSGLEGTERISIFHALNHKACARKAAEHLGRKYEECSLIVAHLGGGISVGVHKRGRAVDVNNALDGDGPFSPERAGGIPVISLLDLCFREGADKKEIYRQLVGTGGLVSYLNTNDAREAERMIREGDEKARLVYEAMAYQVAKEIGGCAAVLKGSVDAVVLTGGLAHSRMLTDWIRERVGFLAPVLIYPGEGEMEALAQAGLRILSGAEAGKTYG